MILTLLASILPGVILPAFKEWLAHKSNVETTRRDVALKTIDERMDARKRASDLRLATAGFWEMRLLTFAIAFPFVFHLWSVWLDTQFMFGWKIPKFPAPMDEWQGVILLSFFGIYTLGKTVQSVGTAIAMGRR